MAIHGHSRSSIFRCHWNATGDYILQCGLVCGSSEDIASERSENPHFDDPSLIWRPLSSEPPPANIRINLILPDIRYKGYIFAADSMGLFFVLGSEKIWVCNRAHNGRSSSIQGQPISLILILVQIENACATSFYQFNSNLNLSLSCTASEIRRLKGRKSTIRTYSSPAPSLRMTNFGITADMCRN